MRDRLGIKPLYWSQDEHRVLFGSELKPLFASSLLKPRLNQSSVASLLRFACVPSPFSILDGVAKLEPGHIATIRVGVDGRTHPASLERYWCPTSVARQSRSEPLPGGEEEMVDFIENRLRQSVQDRMVSDVPIGAFLSGGIDSSLVVALMHLHHRFRRFSL